MFKKGQQVHLIRNWDDMGCFQIIRATVYSCGKKKMVLTNAATGEELGRNFIPAVRQGQYRCLDEVRADLNDEQAEARALEISAEFIKNEMAAYRRSIEINQNAGAGFLRKMNDGLAKLEKATPSVRR